MTQPTMFDRLNPAPAPSDSFVTEPAEIRRLTGQSAAILARLQQGPATRRELTALACNPTARVSDLRRAGHDIPPPVENRETGVSIYTLVIAR